MLRKISSILTSLYKKGKCVILDDCAEFKFHTRFVDPLEPFYMTCMPIHIEFIYRRRIILYFINVHKFNKYAS